MPCSSRRLPEVRQQFGALASPRLASVPKCLSSPFMSAASVRVEQGGRVGDVATSAFRAVGGLSTG